MNWSEEVSLWRKIENKSQKRKCLCLLKCLSQCAGKLAYTVLGDLGLATVPGYWRKMLSSRSQRGNITWEKFLKIKKSFPLRSPRLYIPFTRMQSFAVLWINCWRGSCGKSAGGLLWGLRTVRCAATRPRGWDSLAPLNCRDDVVHLLWRRASIEITSEKFIP